MPLGDPIDPQKAYESGYQQGLRDAVLQPKVSFAEPIPAPGFSEVIDMAIEERDIPDSPHATPEERERSRLVRSGMTQMIAFFSHALKSYMAANQVMNYEKNEWEPCGCTCCSLRTGEK
jgi:hypothetical protein